jgi:hypothetical protein
MQTKLEFKVSTQEQLEVVGSGRMVYTACQVGDWWVTPLWDYQGEVPANVMEKTREFTATHKNVRGLLVAQDMREIESKRKEAERIKAEEEKKRKEKRDNGLRVGLGLLAIPLVMVGLALVLTFRMLLAFDPMMIAVMDDGRWVCLGAWYD